MADAKVATKKPAAKSAAKPINSAATATPFTGLGAKAALDREAIRAARYPLAAKQEAERRAAREAAKPAGAAEVKRASFQNSVEFKAVVIKPGAKFFGIAASERPSKGSRLFAHTHAALAAFGMFNDPCPAVPAGNLVTLMGQTAVSYHITSRNLERAPDNALRLTAVGRDFFNKRLNSGHFDTVLANAYAALFVTGKAAPATGVSSAAVFSHQP